MNTLSNLNVTLLCSPFAYNTTVATVGGSCFSKETWNCLSFCKSEEGCLFFPLEKIYIYQQLVCSRMTQVCWSLRLMMMCQRVFLCWVYLLVWFLFLSILPERVFFVHQEFVYQVLIFCQMAHISLHQTIRQKCKLTWAEVYNMEGRRMVCFQFWRTLDILTKVFFLLAN